VPTSADGPTSPDSPSVPLPLVRVATGSSTCSECRKRRETWAINRRGGGNYRTAARSYTSSLCTECVFASLPAAARERAQNGQVSVAGGYDAATIVDIARAWCATHGDRTVTFQVNRNANRPIDPETGRVLLGDWVEVEQSAMDLIAAADAGMAERRARH
jgi:hypothetical protein